ncbi:hypothetical protein IW140_004769 [Coemansia sp. RSA 1813]|nr:hypothetical protein EV178_004773 [Coemansia sp. RSA 1646]KAJ1768999.1 hypothetical protein LPJ74_004429 [Coemansia sp. RSA 1843]KAJ2212549.1 hypothetical protein EV179_004601 [Coemansia sp. RSA 487]KAJ2566906.1 hypothetical protein IW140_004769 [Coemansia sp. RSA 1813]
MAQTNSIAEGKKQEMLFQELFGDSSEDDSINDDSNDDNDIACHVGDEDREHELCDAALKMLESEMARVQFEALIPKDCVIEHPGPGLVVYRRALGPKLSMLFFEWLNARYFSSTPNLQSTVPNVSRINQGMHFGALSNRHTPFGFLATACMQMEELLPHDVVASRSARLFDQAIINLYDVGEGIGDHIDLLRFEDGIIGFSFGGSATMRLRKLHNDEDIDRACRYAQDLAPPQDGSAGDHVLVRLDAGDVYAMSGDARYRWTHGFPTQIDGRSNVQDRRISVTLRKLK